MKTLTPEKRIAVEDHLLTDKPIELPIAEPKSANIQDDFIDIKSQRAAKDKSESKLFFFVGLSITLLMVIVAFEWKWTETGPMVDLGEVDDAVEVLADIPATEQPPPPPPKQMIPQVIIEVSNVDEVLEELEVTIDAEATVDMVVEDVVFADLGIIEEEEKVEQVFHVVETYPEPIGGFEAFYQFVSSNLTYPKKAIKQRVEGKVFIRFVVETDGSLSSFEVVKGIGMGCDEEAVRVLSMAPNWSAGKQRGKNVRVYKTLPIFFKLN